MKDFIKGKSGESSKKDLVRAFLSASEDYRVRNVHRFDNTDGYKTDAFHKLICSAIELDLIDDVSLQQDFACLPGDLQKWASAHDIPRRNLRRRIMKQLRENARNFLQKS